MIGDELCLKYSFLLEVRYVIERIINPRLKVKENLSCVLNAIQLLDRSLFISVSYITGQFITIWLMMLECYLLLICESNCSKRCALNYWTLNSCDFVCCAHDNRSLHWMITSSKIMKTYHLICEEEIPVCKLTVYLLEWVKETCNATESGYHIVIEIRPYLTIEMCGPVDVVLTWRTH